MYIYSSLTIQYNTYFFICRFHNSFSCNKALYRTVNIKNKPTYQCRPCQNEIRGPLPVPQQANGQISDRFAFAIQYYNREANTNVLQTGAPSLTCATDSLARLAQHNVIFADSQLSLESFFPSLNIQSMRHWPSFQSHTKKKKKQFGQLRTKWFSVYEFIFSTYKYLETY